MQKKKKQFDTNGQKLCWIVTMSKLKRRLTGFHFLNIGITSVHGSSSKLWRPSCFPFLSSRCWDVLDWDETIISLNLWGGVRLTGGWMNDWQTSESTACNCAVLIFCFQLGLLSTYSPWYFEYISILEHSLHSERKCVGGQIHHIPAHAALTLSPAGKRGSLCLATE